MDVIDRANARFWDEPCGTTRLEQLGFSDNSQTDRAAQLAFDTFFWNFYPYLDRHIPFARMTGKSVLEVGLGMGSVSERVARSEGRLTGLDIADGPVRIVNDRLKQAALKGQAQTGSILEAPFPDETFDYVISLGCLHHTGDLPRALSEVHRVLKKGGTAVIMLYYAYSPKRWVLWPLATARHVWRTRAGADSAVKATPSERAGYDRAKDGSAPPETVFTSKRQLRAIARQFESVSISLENLDTDMLLYPISREVRPAIRPTLLSLGKALGVATEDMYVTLRK